MPSTWGVTKLLQGLCWLSTLVTLGTCVALLAQVLSFAFPPTAVRSGVCSHIVSGGFAASAPFVFFIGDHFFWPFPVLIRVKYGFGYVPHNLMAFPNPFGIFLFFVWLCGLFCDLGLFKWSAVLKVLSVLASCSFCFFSNPAPSSKY